MRLVADRVIPRALAASMTAVLLLGAPSQALAAVASSTATIGASIEAKKAEKATALTQAKQGAAALSAKMAEYADIGRRLVRTRQELAVVTSHTAELDASLAQQRAVLGERAVQMYRRGPVDVFDVLLTSRDVQDFIVRTEYLVMIGQRDASLIDGVRLLYTESLYTQNDLDSQVARLQQLQADADAARPRILADINAQQARANAAGADLAQLLKDQAAAQAAAAKLQGGTPAAGFDPATVISDANFRASTSMSAADIQTFLNSQDGVLKSGTFPDHNGVPKTAAQIIADACVAYQISPKVILATLQKEQSLLTNRAPTQTALDWAMGCGKTDSKVFYEYQGFGKQIWGGAQKFDKNARDWSLGASEVVSDGSKQYPVFPTNPGTFAQWRYTPHLSGVTSFWSIYWRYFGDPLG